MPTKNDIPPRRNPGARWIVAGIVVAICVVIGVVVWSGGWGFSNSTVSSPNPAPPATSGAPAIPAPQPGASPSTTGK